MAINNVCSLTGNAKSKLLKHECFDCLIIVCSVLEHGDTGDVAILHDLR